MLATALFSFFSCFTSSKYGSAENKNVTLMYVQEKSDLLTVTRIKMQSAPSFAARGNSRGLDELAGGLISLATNAVIEVIKKNQEKYFAEYETGLTDLYFYDQLSNESAFDPAGMQFAGFRLVRTFENDEGKTDTALIVLFELDTTNTAAIINNSTFRLKLKSFDLRYAKAKIAKGDPKVLNMDFDISFVTSYVNDKGVLFDEQVLGKFYLLIRDAPMDSSAAGYKEYYKKLQGKMITGKSFIVPRSFGYHRDPDGEIKSGYSQGLYSIKVNIKESSKPNFVTRLIMENGPELISKGTENIKIKLDKH
jgi:hypothetical protein